MSQPIITSAKGREFACFPGAVLAFIVNEQEEILMLAHPARKGYWEVINGAMDAGQTVLQNT